MDQTSNWFPLLHKTYSKRKLDAIFLDIPGFTGIADDMIIYGKDDLEHDGNLVNFLEVCRKNNLILNAEKMQFRLPKVSFFGHTWSDDGLFPDPKKIQAVRRMEIPQDMETMRSFLGLVNYFNRFSPCLAESSNLLKEICLAENGNQAYTSLPMLLFNVQRTKFAMVLPFFTSTQRLPQSCRLMHLSEV